MPNKMNILNIIEMQTYGTNGKDGKVHAMHFFFFFTKRKKGGGGGIILDSHLTQKPSLNVLGLTYYIFSD